MRFNKLKRIYKHQSLLIADAIKIAFYFVIILTRPLNLSLIDRFELFWRERSWTVSDGHGRFEMERWRNDDGNVSEMFFHYGGTFIFEKFSSPFRPILSQTVQDRPKLFMTVLS